MTEGTDGVGGSSPVPSSSVGRFEPRRPNLLLKKHLLSTTRSHLVSQSCGQCTRATARLMLTRRLAIRTRYAWRHYNEIMAVVYREGRRTLDLLHLSLGTIPRELPARPGIRAGDVPCRGAFYPCGGRPLATTQAQPNPSRLSPTTDPAVVRPLRA